MKAPGKILVIRGGAIGDFILTLPVLQALRRQFPDSPLHLLAYEKVGQLAVLAGLADSVRPIDARALAGYFAAGGTLDSELADYFAGFSLILSYLYDPDGVFTNNLKRTTSARIIQGPHRPDESKPLHATKVFLSPLEALAIFEADELPRLTLPQAVGVRSVERVLPEIDREGAPWIAVHPGSGSEQKNWPLTRWMEFLPLLVAATSCNLFLIGGEAEQGKVSQLAAILPENRCRAAEHWPLPDLAAGLTHCHAFIGHDSGITHLAAALGLPAVVLWGPSNETIWRPRGPEINLLHPLRGLAHLTAAEVLEATQALLQRL